MQDTMPVLREPKKVRKGSRKLIVILFLLFVTLLSVLFLRSSISKISVVTITGGQYMDAETIKEAAGIIEGDSYFHPSARAIEDRIRKLKPVESVTVTKSFPGEVAIEVQEFPSVAYELLGTGEISAILSNGTVVTAGSNFVVDKPVLNGWAKDNPHRAALTKALATIPSDLLTDFSEIVPYPSKSFEDRIKIYTRTRFEIVTAVSLLAEKAETINAVIETQEPGLVTLLLSDRYVPYVSEEEETEGSE